MDAGANDEIVEHIASIGCLTELRITNCPYVAGAFLHKLKSYSLRTLDFRGSYQIEFPEIVQCILNNQRTLRTIKFDGEGTSNNQMVEAISGLAEIEELHVMFGEELEDSFFYKLVEKVNSERTRKLVLRKAMQVSRLAINELFSTKQLRGLISLNLDECITL